jgi:hypothetical protein
MNADGIYSLIEHQSWKSCERSNVSVESHESEDDDDGEDEDGNKEQDWLVGRTYILSMPASCVR